MRPPYSAQRRCRIFLFLLLLSAEQALLTRSVHRPHARTPSIEVFWSNDLTSQHFFLTNQSLKEWSIFGRRNSESLAEHQLPEKISYRHAPEKTVDQAVLCAQIDELISEILKNREKKAHFAHFKILKDSDFNYIRGSGVLIAKFTDYPFVIKLFRETPETFTAPFTKGFVPSTFFVMGGGINRFLAGFTRIKNLDAINQKIAASPRWAGKVSTPRKWYWEPANVRSFTVIGHHIGAQETQSITYPSVYCIICDEMHGTRELSLHSQEDRTLALELSNFIGNRIDPHICNFMIEKETGNIAFVDTEHFASIVGLDEPLEFKSYTDYFLSLAQKCLQDAFFTTKRTRLKHQQRAVPQNLIV
ncbi:MAG: hypothetical protein UV38_C0002G0027 [candidate division TM6 bacterium GW2011_GWE2_42_60]|nr:MAG: hypothetical protein UV38_C0002G0027 [candidate division TM6 bacterium GW2011_GWE2_42_60]HBY06215.1 hypothetical protein [Candidatus Dependentiae bacterium]